MATYIEGIQTRRELHGYEQNRWKLLLIEVLIQVSVFYDSSFLEKDSEILLDLIDLKLF